MKTEEKKSVIQLKIDFLLPYELTPTKSDIDYELKEFGTLNFPCTLYYFKTKRL